MSASWNVLEHPDGHYVLLNPDETVVHKSPAARVDIVDVLSQLEELGVPPGYTRDLSEIYFTTHLSGAVGTHEDDVIRVVANILKVKVLIHELGHHIDDLEDVTLDGHLTEERKESAGKLDDAYGKKNDAEYLAVGFEVFYAGNVADKRRLKKNNPLLHRTIQRIHERYQKR